MRVVSSLADIDFGVGRVRREGADLVIESSADSTIETKVSITPRDGVRSLAALAASPSAWMFLLSLPFAAFGKKEGGRRQGGDAWEMRRKSTGLNKPW